MRRIALLALGFAAPAICCSECERGSGVDAAVRVSASISWEREYDEIDCCGRTREVTREVEWKWHTTSAGTVELRYRTVCYGPRRVVCHIGPWRVKITGCGPRRCARHVRHYRCSRGSRCTHIHHHLPRCRRPHGHPPVCRRKSRCVHKRGTHVHHHVHREGNGPRRTVRVERTVEHETRRVVPGKTVRRRPIRGGHKVRRASVKTHVSGSAPKARTEKSTVVTIAGNGAVRTSKSKGAVRRREVRQW
ncbi:MAG: hypothetical protein GF344_20820 [Chitinivibrionales bacterium]|nr:hypothetical protein [Chitinivibrionales bacterium]MBD3359041.1 hypothetical protein [Chitinivibrionales bacterium]